MFSGNCGNAGAVQAGVLSTKIRVLLRPGGVEGHPRELCTTSVMSSRVCFRASILAWLASFSATSGPANGHVSRGRSRASYRGVIRLGHQI
jgi:hypothetical protein